MKRGVIINLIIIFLLSLIILLPILTMFISTVGGQAAGCNFNRPTDGPEICSTFVTLTVVIGWGMIAIVPIFASAVGIYLLGVFLFFIASVIRSQMSGKPISPVAAGMFGSTVALLLLAGCVAGAIYASTWASEMTITSICNGLPQSTSVAGVTNGRLAVSVQLPKGQAGPEGYAILSVPPEGGAAVRLSELHHASNPSWSPDGMILAFAAQDWRTKLWSLNRLDEQDKRSILLESELAFSALDWTPDGAALLYEHPLGPGSTTNAELFLAAADGSNPHNLPGSPVYDGQGRISPDGKHIVFVSEREPSWRGDIYLMNVDGSNVRRLTFNAMADINPAWSPDGKWIVFASNRNRQSDYDLYVMDALGNNQCQLTHGEDSEWQPAWSPDGQWIAYIALKEHQVYRIRPNGSETVAVPIAEPVDNVLELDWAVAP
jgi:Tol biopolymer transport system component